MTWLLVDIGNTRIKWGLVKGDDIIAGQALVHQPLDEEGLSEMWRELPTCECMAISCVSPRRVLELVSTVALVLWPKIQVILAQSQALAFGVCNSYNPPENLGVDRWLSLIAVRQYYKEPACIVDCGTAITLDFLDADGHHQGGLICPGLTLMKKSLAQGTETLPFNIKEYPVKPANFTDAAIYSGTLNAAAGFIEHALSKQAKKMTLILTGGDAELIAGQLEYQAIIDAHLVLRGLARILAGQQ